MARGAVAKPMADRYSSPYRVLEHGKKGWKVQVEERVVIISRDRLKPPLGSVTPKSAFLTKRGRPRAASVSSMASDSVAVKAEGPV